MDIAVIESIGGSRRDSRANRVLAFHLRIVRAGAAVILACIVAVGALSALARLTPSDSGAEFLGHPLLVVTSGSMEPTIPVGSLVVLDKVTVARSAQLHVGDVVTFRAASGSTDVLVTHRIVEVRRFATGVEYVTKGDANPTPDLTLLDPARVVGVYSRHFAHVGRLIEGFTQWQVVALVAFSLLLAHAGLEQRPIRGTHNTRKEQT